MFLPHARDEGHFQRNLKRKLEFIMKRFILAAVALLAMATAAPAIANATSSCCGLPCCIEGGDCC